MAVPGAIARSTAFAPTSHSERRDGNPIQNNMPDIPGGGARGPSDATGASS
jgi:hypothetical protein